MKKTTLSEQLLLPVDHPLMVCNHDSPQWSSALNEYYAHAIKEAEEGAIQAGKNEEDGGTCNLDAVTLDFTGWKQVDIDMISTLSGVDISEKLSSQIWKGCCFVSFTSYGQANRRTRMVEAAAKVLEERGLPVMTYYAMD